LDCGDTSAQSQRTTRDNNLYGSGSTPRSTISSMVDSAQSSFPAKVARDTYAVDSDTGKWPLVRPRVRPILAI
jgi:hypothetical protein